MTNTSEKTIGGGAKKVLYTLKTVGRIGVLNAAKALNSKNTCKACAYGMGGQNGGMTNELGEFPSVCNKSVQAQSTDIQPIIPEQIFDHPLEELQDLSAHEIEHLGRLGTPIYKSKDNNKYRPVTWSWAIEYISEKFKKTTPGRTFFYSSGRSSNEAGFVLQLFARLYGTNNVNNCSYFCHQATSVGLSSTIGTGTSTIELDDLTGCDTIFVIGANPSSNHPRFIHMLKACRDRGGQVIIINPAKEPGLVKFSVPKSPKSLLKGGDWIASEYLQPNIGSDIALFKGLAKAVLEMGAQDQEFIEIYSSNYEAFKSDIENLTWQEITTSCGISQNDIEKVAAIYAKSVNTVFAWGMGMTHHLHGSENVEYIANLAMLRGMLGRRHAGLLPLRGHSNVQGIGTIGVKPVLTEEIINKFEQELSITLPKGNGVDTMSALQAAYEGKMDIAFCMGGNLYEASPNQTWAKKALDKIGFKIFLTTTLNKGHVNAIEHGESIVLPVTARDEEVQPTTQESMFNYVRLSDGGIKRFENVRPESAILCDIARNVVADNIFDFEQFQKHQNIREAIAKTIPGMEQLADIDVAKKEFHIRNRLMHEPEFKTNDGRAKFQIHPIPAKLEKKEGWPNLFMLASMRSEGQFNSIIYEQKDSYRQANNRWCVFLNKGDMESFGLSEKSKVTLHSEHGCMADVNVYEFNVPLGNALAYYPEANILTSTDVDHRSRTPAFKSTPIWIELN